MLPDWKITSFNELSATQLYAMMQLRNEVFVVEQNCVYQDADNKDEASFHLAGWQADKLVAYCRILPPGIAYTESSIGRVVVSPAYRRFGYGRKLMEQSIEFSLENFNCKKITISAQYYLEKFYQSLGFMTIGESYLEDNLPHIKMQLTV